MMEVVDKSMLLLVVKMSSGIEHYFTAYCNIFQRHTHNSTDSAISLLHSCTVSNVCKFLMYKAVAENMQPLLSVDEIKVKNEMVIVLNLHMYKLVVPSVL